MKRRVDHSWGADKGFFPKWRMQVDKRSFHKGGLGFYTATSGMCTKESYAIGAEQSKMQR